MASERGEVTESLGPRSRRFPILYNLHSAAFLRNIFKDFQFYQSLFEETSLKASSLPVTRFGPSKFYILAGPVNSYLLKVFDSCLIVFDQPQLDAQASISGHPTLKMYLPTRSIVLEGRFIFFEKHIKNNNKIKKCKTKHSKRKI